MLKNRFYPRKIFLLAVDFLILFLSLFLSLKIRGIWSEGQYFFSRHFYPFLFIFALWIIVFYLFDLYELHKIKSLSFSISTLILSISMSTIFSVIFFYLVPALITPKTILLIIALISFIILSFWRFLWIKIFAPKFKTRAAIIGADQNKIKILKEVLNPTESDYKVIGFINLGQEQFLSLAGFPLLGSYENLQEIIKKEKIEELITAFDYYQNEKAIKKIMDCLGSDLKVTEMPLFYEEATGKVPLDCIDQVWFLSHLKGNKKFYETSKRIIDIFLSFIGLILFFFLLPLIAFFIKIDSKGPVFYSQIRVGKNEKKFWLYKLRTMVRNAEKESGAVWAKANDPRVTKVGAFLRKIRFDEIPQLFNILKGDMSLVGPRPERPSFVLKLKGHIPFYSYRHIVKPGITGWAQIKYKYGNSKNKAMEKMQYDLFYIKNRSLILYFIIIIRTIRTILTKVGI